MQITRGGQVITFATNHPDGDLVQTSPYLNSADLPVPPKPIRMDGRRVVASTGFLAAQALREFDVANQALVSTWHPGRCYCQVFAGSMHAPGLRQVGLYGSRCKGDRLSPHEATTCGACLAGATDLTE